MVKRAYALFGLAAPLITYITIGVAMAVSPWFNWNSNVLSDLGHAEKSAAAPIFNFGLLLTGFLIAIYAATVFREYAKYSSSLLFVSAFVSQSLAVFDEVYGVLHYFMAVLHFVTFSLSSLMYAFEKRSVLAASTLALSLAAWILYWAGILNVGIAMLEVASKIVLVWIMESAVKIYRDIEA